MSTWSRLDVLYEADSPYDVLRWLRERAEREGLAGAGDAGRGRLDAVPPVIFPFVELPQALGGWPRPVLDLVVGNMAEVLIPCLVDSGAINTLLPGWVADLAGIDCADAPAKNLGVAGAATKALMVPTLLTLGDQSWEAEVGFCDPWPHGWGLLGQLSFSRYFVVTFRAADFELEIEPVQR